MKYINPRQLSFFILNRYFSEKPNLKFLLNDYLKKYELMDLDRRFVYEVVKGTVRHYIRIDFLISLFSNKKVGSIDIQVLNMLRQAVYQLFYMNKTPAYAAINESVEIAKKYIGTYSSRFVNAILRKINTQPESQDFLDRSIEKACTGPAQRLSVMYSYPEWLAEYWIKSFGLDKTELLFKSLNCEPLVFIRVNRLKTDKIRLLNSFEESGMLQDRDFLLKPQNTIDGCKYSDRIGSLETTDNIDKGCKIRIPETACEPYPDKSGVTGKIEKSGLFDDCIIIKSAGNIERIPGFLNGEFSVQDFSSQLAVKYFLDPDPHDRILDICGAPGGKATYMAELTDRMAEIVSVDINKKKNDLLRGNIARLGIDNITIVNADVTKAGFLGCEGFDNYFDKIFIDAPCSALGTISKNPDAKYAGTLYDMERLGEISGKILSAADRYLKPGGIIILYKCTLSEIENQEPVKRFIELNHGRYIICSLSLNYADSFGEGPFIEIMPEYFSSEGGFICKLKKQVS